MFPLNKTSLRITLKYYLFKYELYLLDLLHPSLNGFQESRCFQEEWELQGIDRHICSFSPKDEIFLLGLSSPFALFGIMIVISS
jgi:hypothetical protein